MFRLSRLIALLGAISALMTLLAWSGQNDAMYAALAVPFALSFAAVAIHETAHALAGLATSGTVKELAVRPFLMRFQPFSVAWVRKSVHADYGGWVRVTYAKPTPLRHAAMIAAGPLANLVSASVSLFVAGQLPPLTLEWAISTAFFWTSASIGLANLVPFSVGVPFECSDGGWLLIARRLRQRELRQRQRRAVLGKVAQSA